MSDDFKVTFSNISVTRDGDPMDNGEMCWSLMVDGSVVSSRSEANPLKIASGGTISLGSSYTVTKSGAAGTNLEVSGTVTEKDSGLNGKDDSDDFKHTYYPAGYGVGSHSARLTDKNLDVDVNYVIERI